MTPLTGWSALRGSCIEPKALWISSMNARLRLAIAAFYDADRLAGALRDFVLLGLLPDDLWLLTNADLDEARVALRTALEACGSRFAALAKGAAPADLIPDAPLVFCTHTPVLHLLRRATTATGATCLEELFGGEIGKEIKAHVGNGAMLAMAKAETPELQDHCVRVLLRHSLHTVHSEECGYAS